jgi:hypothetical protein
MGWTAMRTVSWRALGMAIGGGIAVVGAAAAQTVPPDGRQASPPAAAAEAGRAAPTREELQSQLNAQNARNEALRQRIARLEAVLKTDVCTNPEAAALLQGEQR